MTTHQQTCRHCHSAEHVSHIPMPEFKHVRYYRCAACGETWATDLQGVETLKGREAPASGLSPGPE